MDDSSDNSDDDEEGDDDDLDVFLRLDFDPVPSLPPADADGARLGNATIALAIVSSCAGVSIWGDVDRGRGLAPRGLLDCEPAGGRVRVCVAR